MGFMKINGAYQDVDVFNRETSLYSARKTRDKIAKGFSFASDWS